jgi:pimeloyl-ACP methyl ester carboxylesterase
MRSPSHTGEARPYLDDDDFAGSVSEGAAEVTPASKVDGMVFRVGRRGLLALAGAGVVAAAAGAYALVDAAILPGKGTLDNALGRCDSPPPPPAPRGTPQPAVTGSFPSARRRRQVDFAISYPPGYGDGAHLPVCLALHGYGSNCRDAVSTGNYPELIAGSSTPFALAGVDGGGAYWHPHATDDPLGMLVDEFLPLLAARGLDTGRVAVCGWSMGGYGALVCGLTYPGRFRALVATSPAIFRSFEDAHRVNPGAFDTPDEWRAYDVTARAKEFAGMPVRIAIGASDSFAGAVRTLRDRLPDPSVVQLPAGCHDGRLWSYVAPGQIQAIGTALTS